MQLEARFLKIAHDPGDPQLCSHCPFCGSGQITGRSDGGIDCAFCGHSFIVRIQPAFPGMPQAPGMGSPTDTGPDMPGMPPGMDMGMAPPGAGPDEGMPPGAEGGEEGGFPPGGDGEDEADDGEGPPGGEEDDEDGPPPKGKKTSARSYRTLAGDQLGERAYIRHLAVVFSGSSPAVLARLRREAYLTTGDTPEHRAKYDQGYNASEHQYTGNEAPGYSPLEKADLRGEPDSWYQGYMDHATDRPYGHAIECPAHDHDAPGCTLHDHPEKFDPAYTKPRDDEFLRRVEHGFEASRRTAAPVKGMNARTPEERDATREYMRGQGTEKARLVLSMMERQWADYDHAQQCPASEHSNVNPQCTLRSQASRRTAAVINPGAIVQYKGVGQAVVGEHACPAGTCPGSGNDGHRYELSFITGPKAYREGGIRYGWVSPADVVMQKSHRMPRASSRSSGLVTARFVS